MENIIILHGALGVAEDLKSLAISLKNYDFNVYTFSFSGHSKTAFNSNFGIEQFSDELNDFIIQNALKRPDIFGYSMGGYVAMYLASKQKDFIGKIITLGTKFNWSNETVEKETKMLNPDTILAKVPAFAKLLEEKHGEHWKTLALKTAGMMKEIGEKAFLNDDNLKALETSILLGLADRDQMVTLDETRNVFTQLPNAAMYMLPQSKHQIESVDTDLLGRLIKDFILVK
ncbi:alpha/beta fold hydrolase [Aurantibacillus circumpalustris]|uniref:alpha/beta fold hydrolase n=1 Tax=Aurantibacillus circumpalustris TaxID=3036359 RepID=UPI00295A97F8|nr:alpha/beta hydrolase [Aurantibacillus circumpalustris]